jgi:SprT protein
LDTDFSVIIQPLDVQRQEQVRRATAACVRRAAQSFEFALQPIAVTFDLTGSAAGMYRVRRGERVIRYNPYIFAKYFENNLAVTVPHEVAHYVADCLYGLRNIRPHGEEWKAVMRSLGAEPRVTARYDLSGVPVRRQRRFSYYCECDTHQLSACRHNRIQRGQSSYLCRRCGSAIVFGVPSASTCPSTAG